MPSKIALVRAPSPRLAEGIVTHRERVPVDYSAAVSQWEVYVQTLRWHGWRPMEVGHGEHYPDGVFIEDTVVVYKNVAVVARPGADSRRGETSEVERFLAGLGCSVNRINTPGTLDGGDVMKIGDTIYVGRGARTNSEGIGQLRAILGPVGAKVVAVPVSSVLHLKSAVTALPDGTVIGYPPHVDEPLLFPRFLSMPEEAGAHVVDLGGSRLLISASAPKSAAVLGDLGYEPVPVDISEFEKLEGCVTCLSVRLRELYDNEQ